MHNANGKQWSPKEWERWPTHRHAHLGVLAGVPAAKVSDFLGEITAKVLREQIGTKRAKVGHLAPKVLWRHL